jgi:predicted component of type VI protein secretion system
MGIDLTTLAFLAFMALLVLSLIALGFGAMLLSHRQQVRRQEQENELKRDLVAKGVSADEIERIIKATAGNAAPKTQLAEETQRPTGAGADWARLVQVLCEHGMDGADVESVLRAVGDYSDEELPAKVTAIESMVENGMQAEDVERVLRAFQRTPGKPDFPPDKGLTAFRE